MSFTVPAKTIFIFVLQEKNLHEKSSQDFYLLFPPKNIVSNKRLQLRHKQASGCTSSHSHCSACLVLLYSRVNNRSVKSDIFHFFSCINYYRN